MTTAMITSKWGITIPAAFRTELHVGDRLQLIKIGEGRFDIIVANQDVTRIKGLVKSQRRVSLSAITAGCKGDLSIEKKAITVGMEKI